MYAFTQSQGMNMITNIFKPNAMLGKVVGEHKALSEDLTKDDHEIIVVGP
jgi:hypothetical protein